MRSSFKISFVIIMLSAVCTLKGQTYRIEAGYSNPKLYGNNVSSVYFNNIKLGGTAEFKLKNNFSLLTGALYNYVYSNKLQKFPNSATVKYDYKGHSIDIPARVIYTLPFAKNLKAFTYAGPNLNVGLLLDRKVYSTLSNALNIKNEVLPSVDDLYKSSLLNRLNLQVGVGGGVQWKRYQVKGGYDWGINNLNSVDNGSLHQNAWHVSLSYQF
jgi:hypothetical protein